MFIFVRHRNPKERLEFFFWNMQANKKFTSLGKTRCRTKIRTYRFTDNAWIHYVLRQSRWQELSLKNLYKIFYT